MWEVTENARTPADLVGDSAASRLAHLYPELAFMGGAGLDQGFVISAPGATRWEAGQLQAGSAPRTSPRSMASRNQVRGRLAWPSRLHSISTGFLHVLSCRCTCVVNAGWPHQQGGVMSTTVDTATGIRSFHIEIPQEQIDDLRGRIAATRWPGKELVSDRSQGVQLATLQELA